MSKVQTKLSAKQKERLAMPLIARGAELDASIKEMEAELKTVKEELDAYELDYAEYSAPGAELIVKPYRSLNKSLAVEKYGDSVKELVVTPNAVRNYLGDDAKAIAALYNESRSFTFRYVGEQ